MEIGGVVRFIDRKGLEHYALTTNVQKPFLSIIYVDRGNGNTIKEQSVPYFEMGMEFFYVEEIEIALVEYGTL